MVDWTVARRIKFQRLQLGNLRLYKIPKPCDGRILRLFNAPDEYASLLHACIFTLTGRMGKHGTVPTAMQDVVTVLVNNSVYHN